jgi:putative CocE/NonD family hydrolase
MELSKDGSVPLPIGRWDTYDWYLELGPLSNADAKYFHGKVPTWQAFVEHPTYDAFWQTRALQRILKAPSVPTLTVGGWWDQEDRYGPLATYKALESGDAKRWSTLVMGPWNHGGWRNPARAMEVVDPGTSDGYLRDVEAPWFAYWLHDRGKLSQAEAYLYDAGVKKWRAFDQWPPTKSSTQRKLFMHADGKLSFDPPRAGEAASDQYISDPAHPVPYRARPIEQTYDPRGSNWRTWETRDQRFVQGRPDVLSWTSDPLTSDVVIAGDVIAHLVASTTGQDADWVVKLIDVFPDSVGDRLAARWIRVDGRARDPAWPLSQELLRARGARAEHAARFHLSIFISRATRSSAGTGSWCRCRARGFRYTIATRRRGWRTSFRRRPATSRPRRIRFGTHRKGRRLWGCRW